MNEFSSSAIIVSIFLTWGIGLIPPLLIRYVFVKRRISKWPAISVCILFLIFNIILFTAIGSTNKTHFALVLIAFISYWILHNKPKKYDLENINRNMKSKKIRTQDSEYIRCSNCDFEQWVGYENCQKCGAKLE